MCVNFFVAFLAEILVVPLKDLRLEVSLQRFFQRVIIHLALHRKILLLKSANLVDLVLHGQANIQESLLSLAFPQAFHAFHVIHAAS